MQKRSASTYILFIILLLASIIVIMPFALMITASLKTSAEINASTFKFFPGKMQFSNYPKAFANSPWGRWFANTIFVTVLATVVSLLTNAMAGFSFARLRFKGRDILFYSVLLGIMVPPQLTILPTFLIMRGIPLAGGNNILGQGGTGLIDSYLGLTLPIFAGAFGIFLCRQYFLNFPDSLDDAAEIDGAGVWKRFWSIYVPNSKSLLLSLGILKGTYTWNDYIWPLVVVYSEKMMTVQLGLSRFRDVIINWELLMAATAMVMLPLVILFIISQRYFVSGLVTSGMKG
jgi:multiple sugar transport system permease protein